MVKPMDVLRCLFVAMDFFTKWRVSLKKASKSGELSIATFDDRRVVSFLKLGQEVKATNMLVMKRAKQ
jgi:hypothetical protein